MQLKWYKQFLKDIAMTGNKQGRRDSRNDKATGQWLSWCKWKELGPTYCPLPWSKEDFSPQICKEFGCNKISLNDPHYKGKLIYNFMYRLMSSRQNHERCTATLKPSDAIGLESRAALNSAMDLHIENTKVAEVTNDCDSHIINSFRPIFARR